MNKLKGFTLIEVLIALVILSIALTAVMRAVGTGISDMDEVQAKTISNWIADNVFAEIQLGIITLANAGDQQEGNTTMSHYNWHWQATLQAIENGNIKRIGIIVSRQDTKSPTLKRTGLIGNITHAE